VYTCCIVAVVRGMTFLDNIMYLVCDGSYSYRIRRFNKYTGERLEQDIRVVGMKNPWDIVVCRNDRQLYIADWKHCIWRVSTDDHSFVNWLPTESTEFDQPALSLTSRRLLLTSSDNIRQYSTVDKGLLCVVPLVHLPYVQELYHAVETRRGTFLVCHKGTLQDEEQFAVSETVWLL